MEWNGKSLATLSLLYLSILQLLYLYIHEILPYTIYFLAHILRFLQYWYDTHYIAHLFWYDEHSKTFFIWAMKNFNINYEQARDFLPHFDMSWALEKVCFIIVILFCLLLASSTFTGLYYYIILLITIIRRVINISKHFFAFQMSSEVKKWLSRIRHTYN